ncbi:MAG: hypothetical protein IKK71_01035 [Clostridia bacterium]|nr:hypothetical protein [Clostridia bacterium]
MFEKMISIARSKLNEINDCADALPSPQVTVLLTDDDIYIAVNDLDGAICEELKQNKTTKISKMVTMWKDGGIDLASFAFRKALVEMDEHNKNTDILLQGKEDYLIKKLGLTMP